MWWIKLMSVNPVERNKEVTLHLSRSIHLPTTQPTLPLQIPLDTSTSRIHGEQMYPNEKTWGNQQHLCSVRAVWNFLSPNFFTS